MGLNDFNFLLHTFLDCLDFFNGEPKVSFKQKKKKPIKLFSFSNAISNPSNKHRSFIQCFLILRGQSMLYYFRGEGSPTLCLRRCCAAQPHWAPTYISQGAVITNLRDFYSLSILVIDITCW